ncbi:predicted protein [Phaeodactylum tricornutum CCAP 1055/1]|uniref:Uncharacterized protein n=1 Tax=Phaeodactylum tricornutum (strain CCAP 1055/1) TaxID=556484 RepID=B7S4K5_PHATC|nr:predicted protein [Phaeodactylum tricornutum CCAP 1055/1]EEC42519.1 predicted protein [Phaeodactylum tricornutum CCAP 1055/1]|eukprot:XP_002176495.1 predicted protein [Phaeodactylum tricornutum CCAP 1055/1]
MLVTTMHDVNGVEVQQDERKKSIPRWKTSIGLIGALACFSILRTPFYNVSSDRFSPSAPNILKKNASSHFCLDASCAGDSGLVSTYPEKRDDVTLGTLRTPQQKPRSTATYESMCEYISSRSALSLWTQYADIVLLASRLPADPHFNIVERVLRRGWDRYQYLQLLQNPDQTLHPVYEPPIVQVLVVGGSVTYGFKCTAINRVRGRSCAWAMRLESLLNELAGGLLVKIHNRGLGGSNSKTGQAVWEEDIYSDEGKIPDVVINGHSTNDAAWTQQEGGHDYLGNWGRNIRDTTIVSQEIEVLANYYGFSLVSYANVVRDWVYGDTHGTLFSPIWYSADGSYVTEPHPGQGMHLSTMWIMAYHLLSLATTLCSTEVWNKQATVWSNFSQTSVLRAYNTSDQIKFPENVEYQPLPLGLPPLLTNNLSLVDITDKWRANARNIPNTSLVCSHSNESRCIYSWINGLEWEETSASIETKFAPFVKHQGKWSVIDDTGRHKFGWVPAEKDSELLFEFRNLTRPIGTVTLFPMKSYGEKWRDSNSRFRFMSQEDEAASWSELITTDISGVHDRNTSETYTVSIDLPSAIPKNANLRMSMTLTNGTTFKLMGLSVCS